MTDVSTHFTTKYQIQFNLRLHERIGFFNNKAWTQILWGHWPRLDLEHINARVV